MTIEIKCYTIYISKFNLVFIFVVCIFVMAKIILEVLKKYDACSEGIEYFKTLEKTEWDILELMDKCRKDGRYNYESWLWQCIDNQEEFERVIKYYCDNKRPCSMAFIQIELFQQNLKLFYKVVKHQLNNGGYWHEVFKHCGELFKNNTALLKLVVKQHIDRRWSLEWIFRYCDDILKTMPKLYKEATTYQVDILNRYKKLL